MSRTLVNGLSNIGLAGMLLAGANALRGIAMNTFWAYQLIRIFGYELASIIGLIQQAIIIIFIGKFVRWILEGERPKEVVDTHPYESAD